VLLLLLLRFPPYQPLWARLAAFSFGTGPRIMAPPFISKLVVFMNFALAPSFVKGAGSRLLPSGPRKRIKEGFGVFLWRFFFLFFKMFYQDRSHSSWLGSFSSTSNKSLCHFFRDSLPFLLAARTLGPFSPPPSFLVRLWPSACQNLNGNIATLSFFPFFSPFTCFLDCS